MSNATSSAVVFYPGPEVPMSREDLAHTVGRALESSQPLAAALRQILAQRLAHATVRAADERLTEREAGHAAGRIAELSSLQGEIEGSLRAARELSTRTPPEQRRAKR